jgi:hypothetical protein
LSSATVKVSTGINGRLEQLDIIQQGRKTKARYYYVGDGFTIVIKGKKMDVPSTADLLRMIDNKYIQYVDVPITNWLETGINSVGGQVTVHTPSIGNTYRLLGGLLVLSAGVTSAGSVLYQLLDSNPQTDVAIMNFAVAGGALAAATPAPVAMPVALPSNGWKSKFPNGYLRLNCNALIGGEISYNFWGVDEPA